MGVEDIISMSRREMIKKGLASIASVSAGITSIAFLLDSFYGRELYEATLRVKKPFDINSYKITSEGYALNLVGQQGREGIILVFSHKRFGDYFRNMKSFPDEKKNMEYANITFKLGKLKRDVTRIQTIEEVTPEGKTIKRKVIKNHAPIDVYGVIEILRIVPGDIASFI